MIVQYHGKSLISRAIQWQTRSPYSHTAWMREDGSVIESWHRGGVRYLRSPYVGHTPGTRVDVFAVKGLTRGERDGIEGFLFEQVGMGYDFRSVFRFISRRPGRDGRWFCSELVHAACLQVGVELLRGPSWMFAPGHLGWSTALGAGAVGMSETGWQVRYGSLTTKTFFDSEGVGRVSVDRDREDGRDAHATWREVCV